MYLSASGVLSRVDIQATNESDISQDPTLQGSNTSFLLTTNVVLIGQFISINTIPASYERQS